MRRWPQLSLIAVLLGGLLGALGHAFAQLPWGHPATGGAGSQAGTIAIDDSLAAVNLTCSVNVTSCQTTSAFTTSQSGELLIAAAFCGQPATVTAVTDNGPGLTWTNRSNLNLAGPFALVSVWSAKAGASFSGQVTAFYSGCTGANAIVAAFGVKNPSNGVWDSNGALPAYSNGNQTVPSTGPISTTSKFTMLLSFLHGTNVATIPSGWTAIPATGPLVNTGGCCFDAGQIDYMIVSTQQSSLTANYGGANTSLRWGSIGDAVASQ